MDYLFEQLRRYKGKSTGPRHGIFPKKQLDKHKLNPIKENRAYKKKMKQLEVQEILEGIMENTRICTNFDEHNRNRWPLLSSNPRGIVNKEIIESIFDSLVIHYTDEEALISFLEKEMDFPRVDLSSYLVDKKIINLVPYAAARKFKLMPLFKVGDVLTVAMVDPFDILALDEVRTKSKCDVEPMVATSKDIDQAINQYYGISGVSLFYVFTNATRLWLQLHGHGTRGLF